ncbi:unnamed protein product [Closterium sp. NIES-64]|nr:unnamed protein product [Closterium sp. NIES-64]
MDAERRLKQHNGEVVGGAKSTRAGRPWALVSVVSGFRTRSEAFQFEWRWKNPRKLRGDGTTYDRTAYDRTVLPSSHHIASVRTSFLRLRGVPSMIRNSRNSRSGKFVVPLPNMERAVTSLLICAACLTAASATIFPPSFGRVSHGSATHSPGIAYRKSSEAPQKPFGGVSHGSAATLDSPGITYQWFWVKLRPTKHKGKVIGDRRAFGTLFWKIMKFSQRAYYISLYWEYRKLSSGATPNDYALCGKMVVSEAKGVIGGTL